MTEQVIATKAANALVVEAELSVAPALQLAAEGFGGIPAGVDVVVGWFRRFQVGLWVGGTATLTSRRLHFAANSLNKMVHTGPMEVDLDLRYILGVHVERGFLTNIIHLTLPGAVLQIRCWGAQVFADQISDAVRQVRRHRG